MQNTNTKKDIRIDGSNFKVEEHVHQLLKAMNETIHSHEIALLTWVHRVYNAKKRHNQDEKMLRAYAMQIQNAEEIINRMIEIDKNPENKESKTENTKS